MDFPSRQDLFRIARDEILADNALLTREAVERDGSDANVIVAAASAIGDEVVGQLIDAQAGLYLDSAQGDALAKYVYDRFQIVKKAASPAVGEVQFTTIAAAGAFTIPAGTVVQTATGIQFATTLPVTFSGVGPVTALVQSTLAGANQQAKAGTITSIASQIPSSPADLVVTNALATAGADDAETDPSLRDRARRFFVSARRGTLGAIVAGALAVPGVREASAFEILDALGRPAKWVTLSVTDAFTETLAELATVPPTYATQCQAFALTVFAGLEDVRAAGIYVDVSVAQVILQVVHLALTFLAGFDEDAVASSAAAVVVDYVNGLSPGASFVPADAVNALRGVEGLYVTGSEIVSPAGTVTVTPLQVLRTTIALVNTLR